MIILDNNSSDPLYVQIYNVLRKDIISGQLPEGSKLVSTRNLAASLSVSRNTVESAYLQLCSEGYISSKAGSGFIVEKLDNSIVSKLKEQEIKGTNSYGNINTKVDERYKYDFQYGNLSASDFPLQLWKKISNKCLSSMEVKDIMSYNSNKGELDLQIEIMKYLNKSRGVYCKPEQIILSSGIGQSLSLICQILRSNSNQIAVEDPGYDGARTIFTNNGYEVIPIGLENDGINIEELENSSARIVYVTPSHQFPMGAVMPISKRLKLLDWALRKDGIIIEDDYDSELRYNTRPIPSIQGINKSEKVVYVGTFSKSLSPSMRTSYIVLPQLLAEKYDKFFNKYHSSISLIQQNIIQQFMSLGYWERHLRKICISNKRKHDMLIYAVNKFLGDKVTIHGRNAGLHIILELKNGLCEKELIKKARNFGVKIYPVSTFWIMLEKYTNNMVLLGFGNMSENEIIEGIKLLSIAWA
ncbi:MULTISPECIES: PLP-dependent aminotransferase family protein [unclassified Clostridium]|uniref:MocR-like pyridoxine biosynthesis transcription factor PdxR n=1 Tax=unclassified Clostridium TaxID=2614128 RepID=UPI0002979C4E|nr:MULTISPECIES: PLP-dependent aminotransferase family protein [unclassified Clostridium]EKQ55913.1 MAG: transcriptional regulator (HTH and aminotransferase domain containing protein) [Clostridium sp. Maddingley MBC34-26]